MQRFCVTFTLLIKSCLLPFIAALSDFLQSFRCDISTNSYNICVSPQGKILKHNRQPLISTKKKLIIGPPEFLRGSRGPTLLKIHGKSEPVCMFVWMYTCRCWPTPERWLTCDHCFYPICLYIGFAKDNSWLSLSGALMLLAWMVTGSVGTFIASFFKSDWPRKTLLGQKIWFQVYSMQPNHRHTLP